VHDEELFVCGQHGSGLYKHTGASIWFENWGCHWPGLKIEGVVVGPKILQMEGIKCTHCTFRYVIGYDNISWRPHDPHPIIRGSRLTPMQTHVVALVYHCTCLGYF